jgi:hypothetical protein
MTSTATVHRVNGKYADSDGFEGDGFTEVVTDSPFRLGGSASGSSGYRTVTIGGTDTQVALRVGHFPADTTGIRDNDVIEVTAGEHAGTFLRVIEATGADQQTALRLPVYEIAQPPGI